MSDWMSRMTTRVIGIRLLWKQKEAFNDFTEYVLMELLLYLNVADHITSSSLAKGGVAKGHDEHAEDVQEEHQRVKVADVAEFRVNQLKMKDINAFKVHHTVLSTTTFSMKLPKTLNLEMDCGNG
jgi:hypothetical protein